MISGLFKVSTLAIFLLACPSFAQSGYISQDPAALKQAAENFLKQQVAHVSSKSTISVATPDPRLKLVPCDKLSAFLPPGSKSIGRITVGVRCESPKIWSIFLSANVQVFGNYVVLTNSLPAGHTLADTDIAIVEGELSSQASSIITDPSQVPGGILAMPVSAGTPLRRELLKVIPSVMQGQNVRIELKGTGFNITSEGRALHTAQEGQIANVKLPNGQTLSGIARKGGVIEIAL